MLTTLLIIGYIASVFLCRWANKIVYRKLKFCPKPWVVWYIPILNIMLLFPIAIEMIGIAVKTLDYKFDSKFIKWFKGDNWKNN